MNFSIFLQVRGLFELNMNFLHKTLPNLDLGRNSEENKPKILKIASGGAEIWPSKVSHNGHQNFAILKI